MSKENPPRSRRRSKQALSKQILVYFTPKERELVDKAADLERRSISSFVANAAIVAAEKILAKRKS
jgi:uncharacterized protein (DUF1778 family)